MIGGLCRYMHDPTGEDGPVCDCGPKCRRTDTPRIVRHGRVIIVCGGRDYADGERVHRVLNELHEQWPIDLLRHGDCSGADRLAHAWAYLHVRVDPMPADWRHGRSGGPRRNRAMLLKEPKPELVVAFPGGDGTANMVKQARENNVRVLSIT